jgi:TRAP-type mannitol/chloroaromatic compound transport system permease large subunit
MDIYVAGLLIVLLIGILATGLWIGLGLLAVAWFCMEMFTTRMVGDSMVLTIWGSTSSWTLTALPLFLWMGEILFRSKLTADMFKGLAPWLNWHAGSAAAHQCGGLHHLCCGVGFQRGHLRHHWQDHLARAEKTRLPRRHFYGHTGGCWHTGPA